MFFSSIILLGTFLSANADFDLTIQAEDGASSSASINYRSGAINGLAVFLKQGGTITMIFKLTGKEEEECAMQVQNLQYSNDGLSDVFTLELDGFGMIGKVVTRPHSLNGLLWNKFLPTGPIGDTIDIGKGVYNITITAQVADEYGVEIDYVSLQFMNCSNETMTASVVRNGNIHYKEPTCYCEPCAELTTYGKVSIALNVVTCITAMVAIIVPIILKKGKKCGKYSVMNNEG
uniref:Uncharacterized protein n=1 Tax=Amphimedon queenslandica TaxID=400682 RepID=A0A1X7UJ72_AMPQE